MNFEIRRVLKGNRVTIPKKFLRELGKKEKDHVFIRLEGKSLRIFPAEIVLKGLDKAGDR